MANLGRRLILVGWYTGTSVPVFPDVTELESGYGAQVPRFNHGRFPLAEIGKREAAYDSR
jgi:hypothetical protein